MCAYIWLGKMDLYTIPIHIWGYYQSIIISLKIWLLCELKHIAIMGSMHEIGYHVGPIDENTLATQYLCTELQKMHCVAAYFDVEDTDVTLQWLRLIIYLAMTNLTIQYFQKLFKQKRRKENVSLLLQARINTILFT